MKKTVVAILLVAAALAVFATGVVIAQAPQPAVPGSDAGMGLGYGRGMMGTADGETGPLHEYMVRAMAQALGTSTDEFESRRAAGVTAYQIALDLGISADKIPALLSQARSSALDSAVADKVITQAQADWMKSRPMGSGQGNCLGSGQPFGGGMGPGGRWHQTNP